MGSLPLCDHLEQNTDIPRPLLRGQFRAAQFAYLLFNMIEALALEIKARTKVFNLRLVPRINVIKTLVVVALALAQSLKFVLEFSQQRSAILHRCQNSIELPI